MSNKPSKYIVHVFIYELDPEDSSVRDILEEEEVKGCEDEYFDIEKAYEDFSKVKKYKRDPNDYTKVTLND